MSAASVYYTKRKLKYKKKQEAWERGYLLNAICVQGWNSDTKWYAWWWALKQWKKSAYKTYRNNMKTEHSSWLELPYFFECVYSVYFDLWLQ